MSYKNTPFYVGGYYLDRKQGYEVTEMTEKYMKIRYDDGSVQEIGSDSINIKSRIYENILAEYKSSHLSDTEDYFWTLGFLANNSRFEAELPSKTIPNFLNQYKKLTGEEITIEHVGISKLGDVDKWGPELRIYFPRIDKNFDLGPDIRIRDGQTSNIKRINNNSIWNKLVKIGFRLGNIHKIVEIKESIPKGQRAKFVEGQNAR